MKIDSVKVVCFSPTGTSRKIVESIASGINHSHTELIDISSPSSRKKPLSAEANDLLIIAVPVYMGRVPALLNDWFALLDLNKTPAIVVVVYGNRVYDNALLELSDKITDRGGITIAAAAFIGEHSFSSSETPIAPGRPDTMDLELASNFGKDVYDQLCMYNGPEQLNKQLAFPGEKPYGGITDIWDMDFIEVSDDCIDCGICSEACPMGAINSDCSGQIDIKQCITCCACIKACPQSARSMKPGRLMDIAQNMSRKLTERKNVELYI